MSLVKKVMSELASTWSRLNLPKLQLSSLIGNEEIELESDGARISLNKRGQAKALVEALKELGLTSATAERGMHDRNYVRFDVEDVDNLRKKLKMPSIAQAHATRTQKAVATHIDTAAGKSLTKTERKMIDTILEKIKGKPVSIDVTVVDRATDNPKLAVSLFKEATNRKYNTFILPTDGNFDKLRLSNSSAYSFNLSSKDFSNSNISFDKLVKSISDLS